MKIYTRTGDDGETGLLGGTRVSKAHRRVEAYGAVDELNAALGASAAKLSSLPDRKPAEAELEQDVRSIQRSLFVLSAELAASRDGDIGLTPVGEVEIQEFEQRIDAMTASLPELKNFILPGGTELGASLHLARTVCRRAERDVVGLMQEESVRPEVVRYLNRLSDLLFVMARAANAAAGTPEAVWSGRE